jgi:UDP-N-acetylmuramoyl-tripeptide--D-alanyl-D-alanine ligase
MIALTLAEIAACTGGVAYPASQDTQGVAGHIFSAASVLIDGPVVTDSREAGPDGLYVARVGEHADGHAYVAAARDRGAVAALTSHPVPELPSVVVEDVQTAFGRVAHAVLDKADGLVVVGVTGSSGKTSTKDMLAHVLAAAGETVAPVNSLNGEIGVPLTVCRVTRSTRFLVVEMGARGIGHLRSLTEIAPPRIGVVLNVGTAHVGEFGGTDNIAMAKAELAEALPHGGAAILNADDPVVAAMASRTRARTVLVGEATRADIRATRVALDSLGRPRFHVLTPRGEADVTLPLHGRHHVGNALAVIAVALECGMPLPEVVAALATAAPVSRWRMEVTERPDGVTLVNDAYNANPDSMSAALHALAAMATDDRGRHRRTWAVLGEMLELGDASTSAHRQVGADAVALGIDIVVAVGDGAAPIADGARGVAGPADRADGRRAQTVHEAAEVDTAYALLQENLRSGDVVLLKSSRDAGLRWLGDRLAGMEVTQ